MRKSEPPGFWPRLGYLALSFASSARSGGTRSFSGVSWELLSTLIIIRNTCPPKTHRFYPKYLGIRYLGLCPPGPPPRFPRPRVSHKPPRTPPTPPWRRSYPTSPPGNPTPTSPTANERLVLIRRTTDATNQRKGRRVAQPMGAARARPRVPHLFLLLCLLRAGAGTERGRHGGGWREPPRSLRSARPRSPLQNGHRRPLTPQQPDGQPHCPIGTGRLAR